jgi:hypothetical protein
MFGMNRSKELLREVGLEKSPQLLTQEKTPAVDDA